MLLAGVVSGNCLHELGSRSGFVDIIEIFAFTKEISGYNLVRFYMLPSPLMHSGQMGY